MRGSREVAVLVRRGLPFTPLQITHDSQGRYVIVTGRLEGRIHNLVSVYVPPASISSTLTHLTKQISVLPPGQTVMGVILMQFHSLHLTLLGARPCHGNPMPRDYWIGRPP